MSVTIVFRFFLKIDVGVGFGFLNNRDVGVDFDYLTNIALQCKSVRLIVYNINEVCKKVNGDRYRQLSLIACFKTCFIYF